MDVFDAERERETERERERDGPNSVLSPGERERERERWTQLSIEPWKPDYPVESGPITQFNNVGCGPLKT